ncbi:MAG: EthD family reductase [Acidimicrobiia bacterium]
MKKMIGLMARRADMSPEQFRNYWSTTHAEITARVPGLRSYVQNVCLPDENGDPAYDGVAVLGFDDATSMEKALGTPEWGAVMDDVPKFVDVERAVIMTGVDNIVV